MQWGGTLHDRQGMHYSAPNRGSGQYQYALMRLTAHYAQSRTHEPAQWLCSQHELWHTMSRSQATLPPQTQD